MKVTTGLTASGDAEARYREAMRRRLGPLRPDLARGVQLPDSRTTHRDDALAELRHGRVGASLLCRRCRGPLTIGDRFASVLWFVYITILGILAGFTIGGGW